MLNHLLLGQTVTRPDGFWRTPERHCARDATLEAALKRESVPPPAAGRPDAAH